MGPAWAAAAAVASPAANLEPLPLAPDGAVMARRGGHVHDVNLPVPATITVTRTVYYHDRLALSIVTYF